MADDLKIVLKTELEADESASAARIKSQLNNISKLVNDGSQRIKIGVELATDNFQSQSRRITSQIQNIASKAQYNMKLDFGADKVSEMARQLRDDLKVPTSAVSDFVAGIDKGVIGISNIQTGFTKIGDNAKTVTATIDGITASGEKLRQTISQSFTFNDETKEWEEGVLRSTSSAGKNFEQISKVIDKNQSKIDKWAASFDEANEKLKNISLNAEQMAKFVDTGTKYTDAINGLSVNGEEFSSTDVTNVELILASHRKLVDEIVEEDKAQKKSAENRQVEATKLATELDNVAAKYKGVTSATRQVTDQGNLDKLDEECKEIKKDIDAMRKSSDEYSTAERANIQSRIDALDREAQGYSNAEKAATSLRKKTVSEIKTDEFGSLDTLEASLKSAGILTEQFQSKISELRTELRNVTNRNGITDYLASLSMFENEIDLLKARLKGLDSVYKEMTANEREQTTIQKQLISDTSMNDTTRANLESQLLVLKSEHTVLESQRASYADIAQYSSQRTKYEQANYNNMIGVANAEADVAAKAKEADDAMARMPTRVEDLESRFRRVVNPTETLKANMQSLRDAMDAYGSANTDQEKIRAYERICDLAGQCRTEITELSRITNNDFKGFKFDENLKKAQADLKAIERTWSAFKTDPGLTAQFKQLQQSLKNVNNEMDLKKWTTQFSTFKAEVKAAGKNMLSFADSVKNAVSKISQWALGTLSVYGIIQKLESAVTTVVELDTAMIDLRKTTSETEAAYDKFYFSANETAKELGVTTAAVISQTAEWSRLGLTR